MKIFLQGSKAVFATYLAYRLNFILWRFRNALNLIIFYYFWKAVTQNNLEIAGYKQTDIFLYIITSYFLSDLVFSTGIGNLGEIINSGELNQFLLLPYSIFKYLAIREYVDKAINVFFSIVELSLFLLIFQIKPSLDLNFLNLTAFIISILLALILNFLIGLNIGFLGFWSNAVWAPRFIFMVIVTFFSGSFFPLDILPSRIYELLLLTPFPYLIFFPTKIIQGKVPLDQVPFILITSFIWMITFFFISKIVWKKGLKSYSAQGI